MSKGFQYIASAIERSINYLRYSTDARSDRQTIAPVRRSLLEALQKIIPNVLLSPIYFPDRGLKSGAGSKAAPQLARD
jgi:hypothetical protein